MDIIKRCFKNLLPSQLTERIITVAAFVLVVLVADFVLPLGKVLFIVPLSIS